MAARGCASWWKHASWHARRSKSFVPELKPEGGGGASSYVCGAGIRWQSAPDHFKSHDHMVWVPLVFSEEWEAHRTNETWMLEIL